MNSLFSPYDRTVSRRLSRHGSGSYSTYYGGKRRPATTEKLQNGESYGNSRNSASTGHLSSVAEDQGSSGLHLSNSSSLLRPSPYHHSSYDSNGNSGQGGRFLQDIHVPSRMPQRMPTPMPTRSHHYQHARDVLGVRGGLSSTSSGRKYMESGLGHESSSSTSSSSSLLDHHGGGHNPPTGAGSLGQGLSAGQPMMLRTVSRKGTARGGGGGSSDTSSLGGGSGSGLEVAAAGARRRHKSDSAALFTHQELAQQSSQGMSSAMSQQGGSSTSSRASSSHGLSKPGTSNGGGRWQLQLPEINNGAAGVGGGGGYGQTQGLGIGGYGQGSSGGHNASTGGLTRRAARSRHSSGHLLTNGGAGANVMMAQQQSGPTTNEAEFITASGLACGLCTIKGLKPGNPKWQNQDSYVLAESIGPRRDICVYGVLDGHGELGHLVSNRCREHLPSFLQQVDYDPLRACRLMQQDLVACPTLDVQCSGATCVLAVLRAHARTLTVANLGDSRCVVGRVQSSKGGPAGMVAVPLTRDHKPDRPDEHQRILAAGGQVGCRQLILSQRTSHPVTLPMGPPRVWYQCRGEIMGLAMSRSLGDSIVHSVGGSSEAEITDYRLCPTDRFMVIASDGIWDVVDNNQAIQIVQSYAVRNPDDWDPKEAAHILSRFARHRWQTVSSMVDDITCLVIKFSPSRDTGADMDVTDDQE